MAVELYPFQQEGVDYLAKRGGGFLWDEPGLGKTRQAAVAARQLGGSVLIVCPNSLKQWWAKELRNLFPRERVVVAGPGGRFGPRNNQRLPTFDGSPLPPWTIVHYTGVRLNNSALCSVRWHTVILDECHYIKNRKSDRTQAIMDVTPKMAYRIGLTATPFGTNPADLWAQLRWMAPDVPGLRSYWRFYNLFVDYEFEARGPQKYRKVNGGRNLDLLAKVMHAYGQRRTKSVVAPQLPPIISTPMPIALEHGTEVYNTMRRKTAVEIRLETGVDDPSAEIDIIGPHRMLIIRNTLVRIIRLEQWLSHPWTFVAGAQCDKLKWLVEWAEGYPEPAVIATRFKASAYGVAKALGLKQTITGDIPVDIRSRIINKWTNGEEQFMVGTIDTIGIGLSFERAHAMVCYDQLYDPIKMEQLMHRVHRVTTDHPVQIIYLYHPGTTNELILNTFLNKWKQAEMVRRFLADLQESKDG